MRNYRNEIEQFVDQVCYGDIYDAASRFIAAQPNLPIKDELTAWYAGSARLVNMALSYTTNAKTDEDTLSFDAVVCCEIELYPDEYFTTETSFADEWLTVSCSVFVEDRIRDFTVREITVCPKEKRSGNGMNIKKNIVPHIRKEDLEREAEKFLERYCPDALKFPMAVPIDLIVLNTMGLSLLETYRLTSDFSLFGQICFSKGSVKLYDRNSSTKSDVVVDRGTIIIDYGAYTERSPGCVTNTIVHEAVHWHSHRVYAAIKSILRGEKFIACRCSTRQMTEGTDDAWTDERRMEWQAEKIAPRILMPERTFRKKANELFERHRHYGGEYIRDAIFRCVIEELARFYGVSVQSVKIRLQDIGYREAASAYQKREEYFSSFFRIDAREAFTEYCGNNELRKVIDSGMFVYVGGRFAINDEKYVTTRADGSFALTDYARRHPAECALRFTYREENARAHEQPGTYATRAAERTDSRDRGGRHSEFFRRANRGSQVPYYDAGRNSQIIGNAEELTGKRKEFEEQYAQHKAHTKTFWERANEIMEQQRWNSATFCKKTLLHKMTFSRIKNNAESIPDIYTVMAICAGLDLDMSLTSEMLALAGHTLSNSYEHQALSYIITAFRGQSIEARNEFLESFKLKPLGVKERSS